MLTRSKRDPWLDFLRAIAISLVIVFHLAQEWPVIRPWIFPYTSKGAWGVDLFFVLSGWLIGGIYWGEQQRNGTVSLWRFWQRRWLRTIPPYVGGLTLAWIAVWIYRREPFDIRYLFFIQNYYEAMPFFLVSWSLCIEEHFYLVLPLAFFILRSHRCWILIILAVLPTVFRFLEYPIASSGFGYQDAATHLRADGLLLGFAAAYMQVYYRNGFETFRLLMIPVGIISAGLLATNLGPKWEYVLTSILLALMLLGILLLFVGKTSGQWFRGTAIAWMAKISYSLYLTHALVIHAFSIVIYPRLSLSEPLALGLALALVLSAGWVFHLLFELWVFRLRERLAPATN